MHHPTILLFATLLALPLAARAQAADKDMDTLKQRLYAAALPPDAAGVAAARKLADALQADATWPDVDYKDEARSVWRTMEHLSRVLAMSKAMRAPGAKPADVAALKP